MKRVVYVGLALALLMGFAALGTSADTGKDPSIKEIMTKAHKGATP
jgi:hypothetical protein